jgi:plasmid stabilization system protein ParE
MARKILRSPETIEDLEALTAYIASANVRAAVATGRAILRKTRGIPQNPHVGRIVPERNDQEIREIFCGNYCIIHRLSGNADRIEIMRIWHGARGELRITESASS